MPSLQSMKEGFIEEVFLGVQAVGRKVWMVS